MQNRNTENVSNVTKLSVSAETDDISLQQWLTLTWQWSVIDTKQSNFEQ